MDGEGITNAAGEHVYCLLTCGAEHLHKDGARLEFGDIAAFLYQCFLDNPDAVFVGFYLGYDFAQWLRSLPAERAARLLSVRGMASRKRRIPHLPPFPVSYGGWEFDTLALKRFKLAPAAPEHLSALQRRRFRSLHPWMVICDVGAFFQCSFLKAIDPAKSSAPIVTPAEYAIIARGKDGRRSHVFGPEMMRYNALECEVLGRLMTQQNEGLQAEGINLQRHQWIGPGQAAQSWLKLVNVPTGAQVRAHSDPQFRDAARGSYFGGWFEIFWHGPTEGASWSYDINSAYPHVMSRLPCLLHGRYTEDEAPYTLVRAIVSGSHPTVGAALHRILHGKVLRPHRTAGWFWLHELHSAERAGFIDRIEIAEARGYHPCSCPPPLGPIAELYLGRLAIGKNTPAGRARRLIYNSAYGKMAQSVGEPVFANAAYASLITAGCRSMICDAIATHPHGARDLLMVATDGVTFGSRHTGLDVDGARLGAWTETEHQAQSFFMPGVYWDDATRDRLRRGDDPVLKSRGIAARDLARRIDLIDKAWSRFTRDGWPRFVLPVAFQLVSPKQALARGKWELCGTVVTDGKRVISADPIAKRIGAGPGRSRPYGQAGSLESSPYERAFGDEAMPGLGVEFGDHPDMPIDALLPALFRS